MTGGGAGSRWRRAAGGAPGVAAAAALLTLVMAAPVLVEPSTRLFGREIAGRHHDPFTVIAQFEGAPTLGLYTQPATDWVGIAAARLLGDGTRAYHLVVLASFPLAALFCFLLARRLTGSAAAAWPAALIYAFLPFHWAHAAYHPHGAQTQWLPLYLLALWLCAERFTAARAGLLVAAAGLVALSNFYFGLIAAVLTPVALVVQWRLAVAAAAPRPHRAPAATAGLLLGLAGAGLAYVARWAPQVLRQPSSIAFPAEDVERYTARWWCYLVPPVDHPLGGEWLAGFWQRQDPGGLVERQLTLGAGVLALALVAVAVWWRGGRPRLTRAVPVLVALAVAGFVCSLAPVWRLGPLEIPAPSGLLYRLAPMFRAHARFGLAVGLAAAVLAGVGLVALWRRGGRSRAAACGLALLTAIELAPFPPWRWRDVLPTSAHRWLASRGDEIRVIDCVAPGDPAQVSVRRLFGPRLQPRPAATDCGDPQAPALLAAAGFSHLLVRADSRLGSWLAGRPPPAGLEPVGDFADALLFRLSDPGSPLVAGFAAGFHQRELKDDAGYRWMTGTGRLQISVTRPQPMRAALDLRLHAFPGPREIAARLDGRALAVLRVPSEPEVRRLDLGTLSPGHHQLELEALTPATIPDEVLANGDRRPLTIAVWDWTWVTTPGSS